LSPEADAASTAEAKRLFDLQHAASRMSPAPTLAVRLDRLERLRSLVFDEQAAFARAISKDFGGRSPAETRLLEVVPTLGAIRFARKNVGGWMKPQRRRVDPAFQPGKAWIRHEPLGVVGIISPWNYPLQLAVSPLVDAIAAGNRAMVKPSEHTPGFSALLQRLVAERFDEAEIAIVTGGPEVGESFSTLPFDHLLFTGSTAIGRKVYQAAAANLTPVTLELGGKSPAILCPDYPVEKAARSIAFGKLVNAGQTCIAPDYALVPAAKARAFAEAWLDRARQSYPVIAANPDYTAMIGERHYRRLAAAIDEARAAGATVLAHEDEGARAAGKIGPTVILGAPEQVGLMREEIFGPILPVLAYDRLDDAVAYVAARERPLALYCFSNSRSQQRRVLDGTISGGATLNGTLLHIAQESLPFGGIGPSGIGAYHGEEGFRRFSHARSVFKVGRINVTEMLGPPWGKAAATIANLLSRR
jgi:coniferyl-aldehyde dehydrogenase